MASSTCSPPRIPVSQSWMTAIRVMNLFFLLGAALVADVVVAEVVVRRHLFQALDAVVLAGALVERAMRTVVVHDHRCSTRARAPARAPARLFGTGEVGLGLGLGLGLVKTARSPARTDHPSRTART